MGNIKPGPARRSHVLGPVAALFGRFGNTTMRAPIAGVGIAAVALVIAGVSWTRLERDMLPRFNETDVLVEFEGPAGMSLRAGGDVSVRRSKQDSVRHDHRTSSSQLQHSQHQSRE